MQITVDNLSIGYDNKPVMKNISFTVSKGDYIFVVGENGSGKSTLIKTLLGIIKPVSGSIGFGNFTKKTDIGYLPQISASKKNFPAGVYETILSSRAGSSGFKPFYSKKDKQTANEIIKILGIEDLKSKSFSELSGGQAKKVLLARALCAGRKIVILDEPTASLDIQSQSEVYDLISKVNCKLKVSVIMVSHDIEAAKKYATHILELSENSYLYSKKNDYFDLRG